MAAQHYQPQHFIVHQQNGHAPPASSSASSSSRKSGPKMAQQQQRQTSGAADEIYAALQTFVDRNRNQQQNGAGMEQSTESDEEQQLIAAQLAKFVADDPSLLSGLFFNGGSDAPEQIQQQQPTSSSAASNDAEDMNNLDPAGLLALSLLFDGMTGAEGQQEEDGQGQQQEGTSSMMAQQLDPIQEQQNIDFEEVMQRVIGDAMSNNNGGTNSPSGTALITTTSTCPTTVSVPLIGPKGSSSGKKKKSGGGGKRKEPMPGGAGMPGSEMMMGSNPTMLPAGIPIALPKAPVHSSGKKSLSSSAGAALLKSGQFSPTSNGNGTPAPHTPSTNTQKPWSPEELKLVKELESRIDDNIVRLGAHPLNTAELATQCTRLMRGYSIGQRLFARTVMVQVSQSQGSLSELLSKPRPWHKLTDKGREAFRRIYGWISDDVAIDLLCQLSPRKVAMVEKLEHPDPQSLLGDTSGTATQIEAMIAADQLIAGVGTGSGSGGMSMVNVMKMAMGDGGTATTGGARAQKRALKATNSLGGGGSSAKKMAIKMEPAATMVADPSTPLGVPKMASKENGSSPAAGRWRHDDIPREKIIDIFETEKAKLMERESNAFVGLSSSVASSSTAGTPPLSHCGATATATVMPGGQLRNIHRSGSVLGPVADDPAAPRSLVCSPSSVASSGQFSDPAMALDQLFGRHASGGGSSSRGELSAIKFEQYPVLDTEEVVRQVREYLTEEQISQRQFGDSVLGLSQGSVSDLLARPKPWQSLTNKGREPFIRMEMFLEERRAIQLQQQPKEDVELSNNHNIDFESESGMGRKISFRKDSVEDTGSELDLRLELPADPASCPASVPATDGDDEEEAEMEAEEGEIGMIGGGEDEQRSEIDDETRAAEAEERNRMKTEEQDEPERGEEHQSGIEDGVSQRKSSKVVVQSQQNVATNADEVDTADVARRVKAVLAGNGISQRAFGEHILRMTSGCVSDLLTKPKPWVMLSYKGRESYNKMLAFLTQCPEAVDRLKADEQQRCVVNNALNALKAMGNAAGNGSEQQQPNNGLDAALGQQSSATPSPLAAQQPPSPASALQLIAGLTSSATDLGCSNTPIGTLLKKAANSPNSQMQTNPASATMPAATLGPYSVSVKRKTPNTGAVVGGALSSSLSMISVSGGESGNGGKKIPRFQRTIITDKQKESLLFIFAHEQRPNSKCIEQLAMKLGLTPRTVTNWFHNYRTRQKAKEVKPEGDESATSFCPSQLNTPTPAQVLARALNAPDAQTAHWFRELAELLRRHSDGAGSGSVVDLDSYGGSVGTASAASSPPSPPVATIQLMSDDGQIDTTTEEGEGETEGTERALHIADEEEPDAEAAMDDGSPSSSHHHHNINPTNHVGGGGSQLDKAIARMRNRLMATTTQ